MERIRLEGEDYENREALQKELAKISLANTTSDLGIAIAVGTAVNDGQISFTEVFRRADKRMYSHKGQLKKKRPSHNLR